MTITDEDPFEAGSERSGGWAEPGERPVLLPAAGNEPRRRKGRRRKRRHPVYASDAPTRVNGQPAAPAQKPQPAPQPKQISPESTLLTPSRSDAPYYAALDLGTNNCRLLIAQPRERGFRVVDAFSRIVRLGEGVGASGRLGEAAMDRAVEALAVCAQKLGEKGVRRARLIATEACRAADNGPIFLERVRAETGLALEIVSRETEARLAVAGCASLIDPTASGVLLFDIGGGSSELVWIDLSRPSPTGRKRMSDRIRAWTSLPVGVVTLSERHGGEQVDERVFEAMVDEVTAMLDAFPEADALDEMVTAGGLHFLGTSGTVTTLAGVHLGLDRYDRRRVDGLWMADDEVDGMMATLRAMDYAARVANPCIGSERADLVLAGCAILEAVRRRWRCARLRVADRGLREGLLVEMMAEDGVWRRPSQNRQAGAAR